MDEARAREQVDRVQELFQAAARRDYIGESISQLDHALQAAHLASEAGADDCEVVAALLHDVGHLCAEASAPQMEGLGVAKHEHGGADFLGELGFGEDVTDLVRAHVDAKRYLVSVGRDYAERLSKASRVTLTHQGGPMDASERSTFEADPLSAAKLRVRSWDEAAKHPHLEVPSFSSYVSLLVAHLRARP